MESATDGDSGLALALSGRFDVVVLDGMLPGRDGLDVCRALRQRGVTTPILMLSARGQVMDRVVGLRFGADDYLVKPFDVVELLARIDALTRRARPIAPEKVDDEVRFGDVVVNRRETIGDARRRAGRGDGARVQTAAVFPRSPHATLSRDELLDAVWGYQAMPTTRTVDVHVAVLRRKLEPDARAPRYFLTVHGLGYKFVPAVKLRAGDGRRVAAVGALTNSVITHIVVT